MSLISRQKGGEVGYTGGLICNGEYKLKESF